MVSERVVLEPVEEQQQPAGWRKLGEEVTEELDWKPAKFIKRLYIRPKYANAETGGPPCHPAIPIRPGFLSPRPKLAARQNPNGQSAAGLRPAIAPSAKMAVSLPKLKLQEVQPGGQVLAALPAAR
jgi:hypothetical protein